jgi:hypothetical protein
MESMGETNAGWGVCGFTSCLYAMYDMNPGARRCLNAAPQAWSVLYEIEEYLETLKQKGDIRLIGLIEGFTRSFAGFSDFTVEKYLKYIHDNWNKYATSNSGDMNAAIKDDSKFSIGMPPDAVVDYLKRMWKIDATSKFTSGPSDGIVGVKDASDKNMWMYDGLRHYLYQKNGKIYSWGTSFSSVQEAGKKYAGRNYSVCCMITF